ncbi:MAG TPA: FKBP-type peptidyl-prolyl cis-trans isomerase [Gammaproteobacteria bacterium]
MRFYTISAIALVMAPLGSSAVAEQLALDNETARISYSLGYQIGGDFKRQGVAMDSSAVVKGIEDALSDTEPSMSQEEIHVTLMELKKKIEATQRAKRQEMEIKNLAEDKKFLEENASKPGVITTKSGLQYKIIAKGKGQAPTATDQVTVHYRGALSNGQEFDSSYARGEPATFRLDGVIKGWTEGLQHLREGGKIQLVIPPGLAYDRGPLEKRTLLFDVELIAVGEVDKKAEAALSPAGKVSQP